MKKSFLPIGFSILFTLSSLLMGILASPVPQAHAMEQKIDLYAPFSSSSNVFCKKSVANCKDSKEGDGCFSYTAKGAGECPLGSVMVQRIILPEGSKSADLFATYAGMIFSYGFGMGVSFAIIMILWGGLQIIIAQGDSNAFEKGRSKIENAAYSIGILVLSGVILYLINPNFFFLNGG